MNYTELTSAIQDTIENTNAQFVADIPDMIRRAEDVILRKAQLKNFRKKSTATAMVSGDEYWAPPSDYLVAYSFATVTSDVHTFMVRKDPEYIREMYPNRTTTGTPKYYSQTTDTQFIVGPTPDANYATELWYFYRPSSIVDASTSWLGDNAESALFYATMIEAAIYLKFTKEEKQEYVDAFDNAMVDLKREAEGFNTTDSYQSGEVKQERG